MLADLEIRDTADLEVCATLIAALLRCAVSPIGNPGAQNFPTLSRAWLRAAADCQSAKQQVANLPYEEWATSEIFPFGLETRHWPCRVRRLAKGC